MVINKKGQSPSSLYSEFGAGTLSQVSGTETIGVPLWSQHGCWALVVLDGKSPLFFSEAAACNASGLRGAPRSPTSEGKVIYTAGTVGENRSGVCKRSHPCHAGVIHSFWTAATGPWSLFQLLLRCVSDYTPFTSSQFAICSGAQLINVPFFLSLSARRVCRFQILTGAVQYVCWQAFSAKLHIPG